MLSAFPKLKCDLCLSDINAFYDESFEILALNEKLLTMALGHPQGAKSLSNGRVVILRDGVYHPPFDSSCDSEHMSSISG